MGFSSDHKPFKSIDAWKSALMNLPENSFFELFRSVLGNIKTPFSKQKLLDDLVILLSKDEIRKIIAAYINEQDHRVIAAMTTLGDPVPGDLEEFFAGEFTPAEIHAVLINLEERLIVYRFRVSAAPAMRGAPPGGEILRLALNPVLEQVLAPFTTDTKYLFPSYRDETGKQSEAVFVFEDRTIASLFAFVQGEDELFKPEGGIRKKILDRAKKIFPVIDLELVIKTFINLGLLKMEGRNVVSVNDKVRGYCDLSAVERQEYWSAGVYLSQNEGDGGTTAIDAYTPRFSWSRLRGIASFIHRFRSFMDPDRKYPETTLRRIWELLGKENSGTGNIWATPFFDSKMQYPFEPLLAVMEKTGLLIKKENCWKAPRFVSPNFSSGEEKPVIVMDAALSFVLYPEISFTDAMTLGSFCSVKENDENTIRFEISRSSIVRGFDQEMTADEMITLLDRLSLNRLDANLDWTLREWEKRYAEVSLHEGIILTLEEDRRYLAAAGPISRMIQKTLAPGVYLLLSEEKSEAIKILSRAGVDIVAQPSSGFQTGRDGFSRNNFSHLVSGGFNDSAFPAGKEPSIKESSIKEPVLKGEKKGAEVMQSFVQEDKSIEAESIKQNFRKTLEKMKLSKSEKDELLARIERRLVLSDAQLEGAYLRYEKLEARGLDYAGKSAIAKQAIETGSLLEVSWPGQDGETNRMTGIAQALEKKQGDSILVLRSGVVSDNSARDFRIPLGKISLLRRIKQSIFGE